MNILVFNWRDVRHPRAGGAEKYLHEISRRWVERGHRVSWITAKFAGSTNLAEIDGIRIVRAGNAVTVYFWAVVAYLRYFRGRVDCIVDAENGIPFFTPLFAREPILALIFHVHVRVFRSELPWPLSEVFVWLETSVVPRIYRGRQYVTISTSSRDEMSRYKLTAGTIPIVFPGVDILTTNVLRAMSPRIATVGRLESYKRVDVLIRIIAKLLPKHPSLHLDVVGAGTDSKRLSEVARALGIEQSVSFHGFIGDTEKADILAASWAFVSASSMEGWGIVVIEANSLGVPAVVFDVPGLREAVVDARTGFVAKTESEFVAAVLRIIEEPLLRERLSAAAKERSAEFAWEAAADKFLQLLNDVDRRKGAVDASGRRCHVF